MRIFKRSWIDFLYDNKLQSIRVVATQNQTGSNEKLGHFSGLQYGFKSSVENKVELSKLENGMENRAYLNLTERWRNNLLVLILFQIRS